MIVQASCQFCKTPLALDIDDEFAALRPSNPLKKEVTRLFAMASCNRCADLKERQGRLTKMLEASCDRLIANRQPSTDWLDRERNIMDETTKRYVRLVAEWCDVPELPWEQEISNSIMARPGELSRVIGNIWRTARGFQRALL